MDALTEAVVRAAEHGAPPRTFHVGPDAVVDFGTGRSHPYDDLTITHWTEDR
ncbi:hypothetical protein [Prescottella sp. R16]|uniref:Uncharacterized protein n=1 Tax=Nocardia thailandica TaxID=257275 RepID=A0ABW6PH73_9NOCA|nr:hypothetical protein [Prescottella sp. R16]